MTITSWRPRLNRRDETMEAFRHFARRVPELDAQGASFEANRGEVISLGLASGGSRVHGRFRVFFMVRSTWCRACSLAGHARGPTGCGHNAARALQWGTPGPFTS